MQSKKPKKDPDDFGLTFFGKNLTDHKKRKSYLKKNTAIALKGKYLYLGTMFTDHFGHFLAESIHRFWACKYFENEVDGFIILSPHKKFIPTEVFFASCNLLKVNLAKIVHVNKLSEVDYLIVPDLGSSIGTTPKNWYLAEISKRIAINKLKSSHLPQKLFVRRGHQYLTRTIGLSYFSSLIKENGFVEFFPENYHFLEQVKHVISADFIIWEEGSACHILEILPTIKYKLSILIKRREKETAIDLTLNSRVQNQEQYNNVKKIFSGNNIVCDVSKIQDPYEFYSYLKRKKIIKNNAKKFNIFLFSVNELIDFINFYAKYIEVKILYFFIKKIKPNINSNLWNFLKKLTHKT